MKPITLDLGHAVLAVLVAVASSTGLFMACSATSPQGTTPVGVTKADWEKVLEQAAVSALRAMVCTQPAPATGAAAAALTAPPASAPSTTPAPTPSAPPR